jgi:hypothetical protein
LVARSVDRDLSVMGLFVLRGLPRRTHNLHDRVRLNVAMSSWCKRNGTAESQSVVGGGQARKRTVSRRDLLATLLALYGFPTPLGNAFSHGFAFSPRRVRVLAAADVFARPSFGRAESEDRLTAGQDGDFHGRFPLPEGFVCPVASPLEFPRGFERGRPGRRPGVAGPRRLNEGAGGDAARGSS